MAFPSDKSAVRTLKKFVCELNPGLCVSVPKTMLMRKTSGMKENGPPHVPANAKREKDQIDDWPSDDEITNAQRSPELIAETINRPSEEQEGREKPRRETDKRDPHLPPELLEAFKTIQS